jgi:NDP-sugar pyrophosphorylase family protein
METHIKVNQTLIMAGGIGSRLGLGTKSHILYKGKILLEYVVESCVMAGIKNIVVVLVPEYLEKNIEVEKLHRLSLLMSKYPNVKFVRGSNLSFRETPNEVKSHFDETKPFFLLCGQSPQLCSFLIKLANLYTKNSIVCSGYKKRHDYIVSVGKTKGNQIIDFINTEVKKPRTFLAKREEVITHFPYILDFQFYNKYIKSDNYKDRVEFYPDRLLKNGGKVFWVLNPITLSELDYKEELPELFKSVSMVSKELAIP